MVMVTLLIQELCHGEVMHGVLEKMHDNSALMMELFCGVSR
jgi:hypothetical protein